MCRTLSGIGMPNGDLLTLDVSDSHEDIRRAYGIPDSHSVDTTGREPGAVPLEYTIEDPEGHPEHWLDISKYRLSLDCAKPGWVSESLMRTWEAKFRAYARQCILTEDRDFLAGGKWIIGPCRVKKLVNCYVPHVIGGTLRAFHGGTLGAFHGGTLERFYEGTLEDFRGGTLKRFLGGEIVRQSPEARVVRKVYPE